MLYPFRRRVPVTISFPQDAIEVPASREDAAAWLESEWRNILHAARYAGSHQWEQQCADLTHRLVGFMDTRGFWDDALIASAVALHACRTLDDSARIAQASLELCAMTRQAGNHDAMEGLAEDAAAIYRSQADQRGLAEALDQIGLFRQRAGLSREALAYFQEARALYCNSADNHGVATALSHSGIASWHLGRYPEAMSQLRSALGLYREVGDQRGAAKTFNNLGKVQLHGGQHQDALASFEASLEIFTTIDGAQNQAILYHNIGGVHYHTGSHADALAAYLRALATYRALGDLPDEAEVLNDIAAVYGGTGHHPAALAHYDQARLIAREIGNQAVELTALRGIADLHGRSGQHGEALEGYRAALRLARQIGDPYEEAKILTGIAETWLGARQRREARIAFRQALDIFETLGAPEAEAVRTRLETTAHGARRQSSLVAWRRESLSGSRMPSRAEVASVMAIRRRHWADSRATCTLRHPAERQEAADLRCKRRIRPRARHVQSGRPGYQPTLLNRLAPRRRENPLPETKPRTISAARHGKESAPVDVIQAHLAKRVLAARRPRGTGRGPGSHLCPVVGCRRHVDRLMCSRHWYKVPKPLRDAVWVTWRSGEGIGTPEHTDAILAAIAAASGYEISDRT